MKKSLCFVLVVVLLAWVGSARAEGWKWPSLNPFAKKDSHPAHLRIDDAPKSSWWAPNSTTTKPKATSSQPSTWNKMSSGTKSAWTKTKDALNPFDDAKSKPQSVTGSHSVFSQASTRKKAEQKKSSWWPSWSEKPKKPQTVQDFLSQKRPE